MTGVQSTVWDITVQKKAEEELRKLSIAVEQSPAAVAITDLHGNLEYVNPKFSELTGYTSDEAIGKNPRILKSDHMSLEAYARLWETITRGGEWSGEFHNIRKDGTSYWEAAQISPIWNEGGDIAHFIKVAEDVTERKRMEQELFESEEKYRTLVTRSPLGIAIARHSPLSFEFVNPAMSDITGYNADELYGMKDEEVLQLIYSEDRDRWIENIRKRILSVKEVSQNEYRIYSKNRTLKHVSIHSFLINYQGDPALLTTCSDISSQKRVEAEIKRSLKEKVVLLQEVHHRVKNNLQIICSLLSLQSDEIDDDNARKKFEETANRVRSMALVHQELYQSEDVSSVDFSSYYWQLIKKLYQVYSIRFNDVELNFQVENVQIGLDKAVPCGLIANELISNALKYAFSPGLNRKGRIDVRMREDQNGEVEFTVKDNGIGLPDDVDVQNSKTLGLNLVSVLTEHLDGEMRVNRREGAEFIFRFTP